MAFVAAINETVLTESGTVTIAAITAASILNASQISVVPSIAAVAGTVQPKVTCSAIGSIAKLDLKAVSMVPRISADAITNEVSNV